ncbi:MAG: DUF58 domain-containing protein [Candidatus Sericytochromatia bacterium]
MNKKIKDIFNYFFKDEEDFTSINEEKPWSKIKQIEIKTKKLSDELFSGSYRSPFKLTGLDFEEFKEYTFEDELRNIDWKISAKRGSLHIKKFTEEKELNLFLVIDISPSIFFGSNENLKKEVIENISSAIAFGCIKNNIRLGAILFDTEIKKFVPLGKGKNHILNIIKSIFSSDYNSKGSTSFSKPLELINSIIKKKSIVIMLSDFLSNSFESDLALKNELNKLLVKHSFISMIIKDEREFILPNVGLIEVYDPETGNIKIIDTNNQELNNKLQHKEHDIVKFFKSKNIKSILLNTSKENNLTLIYL